MSDASLLVSLQPVFTNGERISTGRVERPNIGKNEASFADIFTKAQKKVSFSKHAMQRLESRRIPLSDGDLERLDAVVDKMAQKGAKESLIYMKDMALVVSVVNKTVITAMDGSSAKENIFTNIDSAAIL